MRCPRPSLSFLTSHQVKAELHGLGEGTFLMSQMTLRFMIPEVENAFLRSRVPRTIQSLNWGCAIGFLTNLALLLTTAGESFGQMMTWLVLVLSLGVVALMLHLPCTQAFFQNKPIVLESLVATGMVAFLVMLMYGQQDRQSFTVVALELDTVLTVSHLMMPVRWCILLVPDILFVVVFTAQSAGTLGQPGGVDKKTLFTFAVLTMGASWGLRSLEWSQRALMALVIDERELRAKAEFAVQKIGRKGAPSLSTYSDYSPDSLSVDVSAIDDTSLHLSQCSYATTDTAGIFENLQGRESAKQLQVIAGLGHQEQWLIPKNQITTSNTPLGRGGFAAIFKGHYCDTLPVAVKMFRGPSSPGACIDRTCINELRFLRRMRHPNIVTFLGASMHRRSGELMLVLEMVEGKTLDRWVGGLRRAENKAARSAEDEAAQAAVQGILQALTYLHSRKPSVVHADLKDTNVMVETRSGRPFAKLLDFGLTRAATRNSTLMKEVRLRLNRERRRIKKTPGVCISSFLAPEVEDGYRFGDAYRPDPAVDMFALGRLLCYVGTLGRQVELPCFESSRNPSSEFLQRWRGDIELCTMEDPKARPSSKQVYLSQTWKTEEVQREPDSADNSEPGDSYRFTLQQTKLQEQLQRDSHMQLEQLSL